MQDLFLHWERIRIWIFQRNEIKFPSLPLGADPFVRNQGKLKLTISSSQDLNQIKTSQMLAAQMERWVVSFLAWDHALSLLSRYVSHGKRAWYISLSDRM